ncbi:hypothetical protein PS676_03995 [Pseudomonas fluorescens]|nr:hypothetical protein PS676_03995 [Pseudomonas fluorescens]
MSFKTLSGNTVLPIRKEGSLFKLPLFQPNL